MTLAVAWLRSRGGVEELLLASDSRLRSGLVWDCGPKLFPLPRTDAAICFAGETLFAFPMILQIHHATAVHYRHLDRRSDINDYKGFLLQVLNQMHGSIVADGPPLAEVAGDQPLFILAGFSWRRADFQIWTLHFDPSINAFTFRPHGDWSGVDGRRRVAFVGDGVDEAKQRLRNLLRDSGMTTGGGFDFEPFIVLRDMIREGRYASIGGPPQLVKVYRHMNTARFGVFWPNFAEGRPTLLGRALFEHEKPPIGFLDPDDFSVHQLDAAASESDEDGGRVSVEP